GGSQKRAQKPHPPLWGATSGEDGHRQMGKLGLGLCSFAVGLPPEGVKHKIDIYREAGTPRGEAQTKIDISREAVPQCPDPIGATIHNEAATFTMAVCAPTRDEAE